MTLYECRTKKSLRFCASTLLFCHPRKSPHLSVFCRGFLNLRCVARALHLPRETIARERVRGCKKDFKQIQIEEPDHEQSTFLGLSVGDRSAPATCDHSLHVVWAPRLTIGK